MEPAENPSAEALLDSLKTIDPAERRKHASVFNYWLTIRGNRQFPPIRDLDPLEISDAGPWSVLLEMIGGGEDAVIRHFGQAIRGQLDVEKIGDAPGASLLSCIHGKLPIVASSRQPLAFEDEFESADGPRRCWITLLPFSANGTWIDFVYGYVSLDGADESDESTVGVVEAAPEAEAQDATEQAAEQAEAAPEPFEMELRPFDDEPEPLQEAPIESEPEADWEPEPESDNERPGFAAKVMEGLASVGGFYAKAVQPEQEFEAEALVEEPVETAPPETVEPMPETPSAVEGSLQNKLSDVRALAEEARQAQLRSNAALYEGLSAAYDFALDAEAEPEEYLRLVEAQGLKIQLRSPMTPVVRLAFEGQCDEPTIPQLEAVLAWALKNDLPRGTLAGRIEAEGGIGAMLSGKAAA